MLHVEDLLKRSLKEIHLQRRKENRVEQRKKAGHSVFAIETSANPIIASSRTEMTFQSCVELRQLGCTFVY